MSGHTGVWSGASFSFLCADLCHVSTFVSNMKQHAVFLYCCLSLEWKKWILLEMLSLACALPLCTVARCDSRCQAACKCHSSAKPAWVMTLSYPQIQGMGRKIQPCSKGSFQIPSSGKKMQKFCITSLIFVLVFYLNVNACITSFQFMSWNLISVCFIGIVILK